jgi:hypothetical protein
VVLSYRLVPALRQEANTVGLTLHLVDEQQLTRYQRQTGILTYRKAQGHLTTLWDRYEEKTLCTSEFLCKVGNLFAPSVSRTAASSDSD